jgi:hypothetical protein
MFDIIIRLNYLLTVAKWLTTMHPWHSKLNATFARVQQKTGRCNAYAADAQLENPVVRRLKLYVSQLAVYQDTVRGPPQCSDIARHEA